MHSQCFIHWAIYPVSPLPPPSTLNIIELQLTTCLKCDLKLLPFKVISECIKRIFLFLNEHFVFLCKLFIINVFKNINYFNHLKYSFGFFDGTSNTACYCVIALAQTQCMLLRYSSSSIPPHWHLLFFLPILRQCLSVTWTGLDMAVPKPQLPA